MAGGWSTWLKGKIADYAFGGVAFTPASTFYVSAYTVSPGAGDTGTEVPATFNYVPVTLVNNLTNFPAFASSIKNMGAFAFPGAGGSWGTIVSVALRDVLSAGNMYAWDDLTIPKAIGNGDTLSFNLNDVNWTIS